VARTIPAVASIALPDVRLTTPTKPVDAGSISNLGHWYDVAQLHNLNLAMMHAQPVYQQNWDGGFVYNVPGLVDRLTVIIPKLTDQHLTLSCRVYGHSFLGGGVVRFTSATTGNFSDVALLAATAWYTGAPALFIGLPPGDTDVITISTSGDVNIESIAIEFDELNPGGAYPGANDELLGGVGPDGTTPLDSLEVLADDPLCSELAQTVSAGVTAVATRRRTYHAMGVLPLPYFLQRPFRVVVPVYDLGNARHTLKFRMLSTVQAQPVAHLIQHSAATQESAWRLWQANNTSRGYTQVLVAGVAGDPFDSGEISIVLEPGDIVQAPGEYFGFAHLTVYPRPGLKSFSAWGV